MYIYNNLFAFVALLFLISAILVGAFTKNIWRNTLLTWALLSIGIVFFGIALTTGL